MHVKETGGPLLVNARVLQPPTLKYNGRQPTIVRDIYHTFIIHYLME